MTTHKGLARAPFPVPSHCRGLFLSQPPALLITSEADAAGRCVGAGPPKEAPPNAQNHTTNKQIHIHTHTHEAMRVPGSPPPARWPRAPRGVMKMRAEAPRGSSRSSKSSAGAFVRAARIPRARFKRAPPPRAGRCRALARRAVLPREGSRMVTEPSWLRAATAARSDRSARHLAVGGAVLRADTHCDYDGM